MNGTTRRILVALLTALLLAPLVAQHAAGAVSIDIANRTWQGVCSGNAA